MQDESIDTRAAEAAWDAWFEARPDGALITPLPITDVQDLAMAMFRAGTESSAKRVQAS